jgi:ubiquinone/menaquinone biosynthesis C-methylase UbiE
MESGLKTKSSYKQAGIEDLAEFYGARYATGQLLDARYFHGINRFDIRWARTMWVYDNVRSGSSVLDIGCGAGVLALLKRKEVRLVGVDLSADCAHVARRNGYDETYAADLTALPFSDSCFDYVVSLDVMGHVEFECKDAVLAEVRRVLKPDGETLHGIESMNREKRKDYDQMTKEELRHFISIDGHVGMEAEEQIKARFSRLFSYVQARPRFSICLSVEEFLKQAHEYDTPLCDATLVEYLEGLSFDERRAFDIAMGYVFEKISEFDINLPKSEYLFLKASNVPLGRFYNQYQAREELAKELETVEGPVVLDQSRAARFSIGWYDAELLPPIARWMGKKSRLRFKTTTLSKISLDLTCHMPDILERPLQLDFFLNGHQLSRLSLAQNGWRQLELDIPAQAPLSTKGKEFVLEIRADRTWQPCSTDARSNDDRALSVAVCNIEILP